MGFFWGGVCVCGGGGLFVCYYYYLNFLALGVLGGGSLWVFFLLNKYLTT